MKQSDTTNQSRRLKPDQRHAQLLDVALKLAGKHGLTNITREQIALAAEVSPALVSARLGTMIALRRTVMRQACARGDTPDCLAVVAQGLASRDKFALKAAPELRQRALATLRG